MAPDKAVPPGVIPLHITYHKWLANEQLIPLLSTAGMVISRSGYSTLMDLVALRKKAILIPTPVKRNSNILAGICMSRVYFIPQNKRL